jgi:hypothetical protein
VEVKGFQFENFKKGGEKVKNKVLLISLAVVLALSISLIGCGGEVGQQEEEEEPEIPEYNLTISSTKGGSVITPGQGTASFTYDEGEVVNLEATPDDGYRFLNWTGDVGTIADVEDATTRIIMNGDYSISANFRQDEVVTFIDPNLEAAVRHAIAKHESPIYTLDMEQLGGLDAEQSGISDLTGLEYATHLRRLILGNNQISDIKPLVDNEGISEGDEVDLYENPLSSASVNTYIPQLEARGVIVDY